MRHLLPLVLLTLLMVSAPIARAVPIEPTINVQGLMESAGGAPLTGTYATTLRLFGAQSGGTALHSQVVGSLAVADGRFDTTLGPLPNGLLDSAAELWLEVEVEGLALPRTRVRATPYALVAERSRTAATAEAISCTGCVAGQAAGFAWALGVAKGGAAADLDCAGCVSASELEAGSVGTSHLSAGAVTSGTVAFNYAGSTSKGGPATELACTGCITGGHIAANAALAGNVSVSGTLAVCTGLGACTVSMSGGSALAAPSGGGVNIQSDQGVRVRNAANSAYAPAIFGAATATGDVDVSSGNLTVSGNTALGTSQSSDRLRVQGAASVTGTSASVGLDDGLAAFPTNQGRASLYRSRNGGGGVPFDRDGNLVLQPQTTTGNGRAIVLATGAGTPLPRLVVDELGRVGVGTVAPEATLSVAGSVQLGDDGGACTTAKAGTLRWTGSELQVCDGEAFVQVGASVEPATPKAVNYSVESGGSNWVIPQGGWGNMPDVSMSFSLSDTRFVHLRLIGTQRWAGGGNGLCHVGYRFVIDGQPTGEPSWGNGIVVSEGATRWHAPVDIEGGVTLQPGNHTITAQATNASGYGNCYVSGDGGLPYDKLRMLASAYVPEQIWWAQSTGEVGLGPSASWADVPGVSATISLAQQAPVQISMAGTQHQSNPYGHCAYRFVIDGQGQGHPSHGQAIVVGDGDQGWWTPALIKMGATLGQGTHTIKLQMANTSGTGTCYAGRSNTDYSRYRMLVRVVPPGGASASFESNSTGYTVSGSWTTIPGLSAAITLAETQHVLIEMAGTQRTLSGSSHAGYRLVIDGTPIGDGNWGLGITTQEGAETWWAPAVLGWGQNLGAGTHTIAVQARDTTNVCLIDADNQSYGRYRMLIRAAD